VGADGTVGVDDHGPTNADPVTGQPGHGDGRGAASQELHEYRSHYRSEGILIVHW
jgi:hypothetical protein